MWWRWRESNPLHQMVYNCMILLNNIRLLKSLMGQVCQKNLYKIDPNYFVNIIMINYIINQKIYSSMENTHLYSQSKIPYHMHLRIFYVQNL